MLTVSVVIPTRNRCAEVTRLLGRLAAEEPAGHPAEVIVVDDGSTDGTADRLRAAAWPFPLQVVQRDGSGAAVARNAGAGAASADVLIFLDDDVDPAPGLVRAHVTAHLENPRLVAVGVLPPSIEDPTFFGLMLRSWWDGMQSAVRDPGHRYTNHDLLSGHFSIRRGEFLRLGGFDERLRCREDYELGYRVIAAGLDLRFLPAAAAAHHDTSTVAKAFRRKLDEGIADVQLLRLHPELAPGMPLSRRSAHSRIQRGMIWLVWSAPRAGQAAAWLLTRLLPALERLKRRRRWRSVLGALLSYWYWRGVASAAGSYAALQRQLEAARRPAAPRLTIDLAQGLDAGAARLDAVRPRAATIVLGPIEIGEIPDLAGAEALRGAHLRLALATTLRTPFLRAMYLTGAVPPALSAAARAMLAPFLEPSGASNAAA